VIVVIVCVHNLMFVRTQLSADVVPTTVRPSRTDYSAGCMSCETCCTVSDKVSIVYFKYKSHVL